MGVNGLLPELRPAAREVLYAKECRGQRNGFDGHVWLHSFCCVHYSDVVERQEYSGVVKGFVLRAKRLLAQGMHIVIILDGKRMPGKTGTDDARQKLRADMYAKAQGANTTEKKRRCLMACVAITPKLVDMTIQTLRKNNIQYVLAPYEGDSQLIGLDQLNHIDNIFTIDSDLVAMEGRRVFLKTNYAAGTSQLYEAAVIYDPKRKWPPTSILLKACHSTAGGLSGASPVWRATTTSRSRASPLGLRRNLCWSVGRTMTS